MTLSITDTIEDLLIEAARVGGKSGDNPIELTLKKGNSLIVISVRIEELSMVARQESGISLKH